MSEDQKDDSTNPSVDSLLEAWEARMKAKKQKEEEELAKKAEAERQAYMRRSGRT